MEWVVTKLFAGFLLCLIAKDFYDRYLSIKTKENNLAEAFERNKNE